MNEAVAIARPRAGRPTREQAEARHEELLDRALDHFLDKGYEMATIEAIAADVGMTKRTVYARYADKAALFRAAVHRAIVRFTLPDEQFHAVDNGNLEETLLGVAMLRINLVASPQGLKLQRIVHTESYRFPDLFTDSYEIGALPAIRFLTELFERETRAGTLAIAHPRMAATAFLTLVATGPTRFLVAGIPLDEEQTLRRVRYGIDLFLNGTRPR